MANIVYRGAAAPTAANTAANKNAALTNDEIDKNFFALNDAAITIGTTSIKPSATSLTLAGLSSVTTTRLLAGDGTAASPSIAFAGDGAIDTGFYWGTDGFTFFTNNGVKTGEIQPGGHLAMVGNVTVGGNLIVNGTTTTVNATTITVDDINIELGSVATPTDTTANGGGITLKGTGDKTITWDSSNANWTSNQDWNIVTGKAFEINNVSVLNATTLGTNVVNSSLTKLGTGAGFVKSDASGNLTVDASTYSLSSHGHYIGTTAVQASSADQAVTGILSVTGGTASNFTLKTANVASAATGILYINSGDVTAGNASSGAISLNSGNGFGTQAAGSVSIYSGDGGLTSATGGNVSIQGGGSRAATSTGGNVSVRGGSALSTATTAATGGNVFILGGRTYNASGTKAGGNVYIDGGIDGSTASQYVTTAGTVNIGNNASGVGGAGTSAVNIGSTSATTTIAGIIKLPTVGASGFVKLSTGGQLSADTTAYLSGVVAIANGGTNVTTYAAGDILYASAADVLSKLAKGSNGQVLKLASGLPAWGTDNDNDTTYTAITATEITTGTATDLRTITGAGAKLIADRNAADTAPSAHGTAAIGTSLKYARQDHVHASDNTDTNTITTIKGGTGTAVSGAVEFAAGTNVSITQAGQVVTINSSYTDTNTTYSASTGLTLTGTAFSANYGTTSTTACAGNDARLSDSRAANGGTATNANNVYVTQTDNTTNYDYSLLLTAGATQNISLRADITGGPTYNPLRNALCLDGFASHVWAYPALQLGRDWSIAQDAYGYSFAAGCKATNASVWTGTGNFSKAMRFTLDANYGTFYWYVKPTDTADTTTSISFRTAMSLDIDGNLNTFGTVSGSNLSGTNTGDQTIPTTLPHNGTALSATTGTFSGTVTLPTITAQAATTLTITGAASSTTAGTAYAVNITGGTGWDGSVAGKGGAVNITGGRSGNNGTGGGAVYGGVVTITGGAGNTLFNGSTPGGVVIAGGAAQIAGQRGADVSISASDGFNSSTSATGGNVTITSGAGAGSSGSNGSISLSAPGTAGGTKPIITFTIGSGERARINSYGLSVGTTADADTVAGAGSILAAGNITAYSDARIKTNIVKITDALDKVEQLNGYTFDRTDTETTRQTGVIAQEVLKVLPEAVLGSEDTTYSVAYGNMMGLMIEAIKELNAKVTDLQNQLANK
jgi:hypothetical protein